MGEGMKIHEIKLGKTQYNLCEASAPDQQKLLSFVGGRAVMASAQTGEPMSVDNIVGMLITLPQESFDAVADIVLYKTIKKGAESPVDVYEFQGRMTDYYLLIAHGIKANLDDFFTYLQSSASEKAKPKSSKA